MLENVVIRKIAVESSLLTVNIIRIIQWFRSAPNHGKCCRQIRCFRCVDKFHAVTVDGVAEQLCIHTRHTSLNIELAHESRLNDKLSDDMHFHFNRFLRTRRNENFAAITGGIYCRAKTRTGTITRTDALCKLNHHENGFD